MKFGVPTGQHMKWVAVTAEIHTTAERYQHTLSLDQTTSAAVGKPHKFNFFPKRNRTFLRYVFEKSGVRFWQVCDGSQPTTTIPWENLDQARRDGVPHG